MGPLCLSMIVKNANGLHERSLRSVRPLLSCFCIVTDPGGAKGVRIVADQILADLPGHVYERPWVNHGANRTEALRLAQGLAEYAIVLDADDEILAEPGFTWPPLTADAYRLCVEDSGYSYNRPHLLKLDGLWGYDGTVHERLVSTEEGRTVQNLPGLVYHRIVEDPYSPERIARYRKEALFLLRRLEEDPKDARNVYYCSQSLRDAGFLAEARTLYLARARMGGAKGEVYHALFEAAKIAERIHAPSVDVVQGYLDAHKARPNRAEPLVCLSRYLRQKGEARMARGFALLAAKIPMPTDDGLVDRSVYEGGAEEEVRLASRASSCRPRPLASPP